MTRIAEEERTLDLIYNAAVQPSLWPAVTDRVVAETGGLDGSLTSLDVVEGTGSVTICPQADSSVLTDYFAHYYKINPFQLVDDASSYARDWRATIRHYEDIMPREEFERTEYFNDFIRPLSVEHGMIIRLGLRGSTVAALNIGRPARRGGFEPSDIAVAERLQSHLVRAFAMTSAFADLNELNAGLTEALNRSPSAMLLLNEQGRILHANAVADRLLAAGDPLQAAGGRLVARDPTAAQALEALIGRAAAKAWEERLGATLALARLDDHHSRPLVLTASPLRLEAASAFAHGPAVLLSVRDPAEDRGEPPPLDRYALTQAEQRLARALCDGFSLRQASDRHAVSFNTARAQLAAVFAKTGTRRQIDLVRLLTAG